MKTAYPQESQRELLAELIEDQILAQINPDEIRARRKMRKNEYDLNILKEKIERNLEARNGVECPLVLSNRELRLLRHLNLSDGVKDKLKSSIKIAKKLEKLEKNNATATKDEEDDEEEDVGEEDDEKTTTKVLNFDRVEILMGSLEGFVGESNEEDSLLRNLKDVAVQTR